MGKLPLEGIRVVGITVVWAGPLAEMILADWGAEVIRVESTQRWMATTRGSMARPPEMLAKNAAAQGAYVNNEAGERPWNRNAGFNYHARNKKGCTMDLTKPRGRENFKKLIAQSDIFIENNAGGVMERMGLGWSVLSEVNPRLIMMSLPGYGNSGPNMGFHGYGLHQESFAGHTWLRGYPDLGPEYNTNVYHADPVCGAMTAFAVMAALRHRKKTGKGQFIDMAQTETALCQQFDAVLDYTMNGRVRKATGNRDHAAAPCGAYRCQGEDEWVSITVNNDEDWAGFCRALGGPAWTEDEKFSSAVNRWHNQDELDKFVEAWTVQHSNYEIMYALQKENVAAGPVLSNKAVFDDPQLKEREQFQPVYQEDCGAHLYPGNLWRADNTPNSIRTGPVRLGEHNEYVYKELLGISDEEYAELEKEGHIGTAYAPHVR